MKGTDHACSLNPTELKQLVKGIREVEAAMGSATKRVLPSELPCKMKLGKTVVASKQIEVGEEIKMSSIAIKVSKPHGLQTNHLKDIIGRKANRTIMEDTPITYEDIDIY